MLAGHRGLAVAVENGRLGFANNGVLPTTADIKLVNMQPYLRLSQVKPGVELRVLFLCNKSRVYLKAGIVTDQERSSGLVDREWLKRSYLELDGQEAWAINGNAGAAAKDSVVWLARELASGEARGLLRTNELGLWLDGFGMVRVGGTMDLRAVRPALTSYVEQCLV